jgi:hypothetical protein
MHVLSWLFGGIVGGAIGAAVWVAIECCTQSEFAWMAWPVGLLVGWGVHKFASADTRGGFFRGTVATVLALAAILGAGWSKQAILTKQAAKTATPAVVGTTMDTGGDEKTALAADDLATVELSEQTGLLRGALESKPRNAFQSMDMLWICLAALTAYVVGKGSGSDPVCGEALADEERAVEEQANEESTD